MNNQEIKKEIKTTHGDKWKWKHNDPKSLGCSKSYSKREIYSNAGQPQKKQEKSQLYTLKAQSYT